MTLRSKIFLALGVFAFVGLLALLFKGAGSSLMSGAVEVDWRALSELDYMTGEAPEKLKALDGKLVKIPGFMVPLEDNQRKVKEFLLVPSPQACIHVPPPPPNQMVYVDMAQGESTEAANGPIWIYGKLKLTSHRHQYGESSFQMEGLQVEEYR